MFAIAMLQRDCSQDQQIVLGSKDASKELLPNTEGSAFLSTERSTIKIKIKKPWVNLVNSSISLCMATYSRFPNDRIKRKPSVKTRTKKYSIVEHAFVENIVSDLFEKNIQLMLTTTERSSSKNISLPDVSDTNQNRGGTSIHLVN